MGMRARQQHPAISTRARRRVPPESGREAKQHAQLSNFCVCYETTVVVYQQAPRTSNQISIQGEHVRRKGLQTDYWA